MTPYVYKIIVQLQKIVNFLEEGGWNKSDIAKKAGLSYSGLVRYVNLKPDGALPTVKTAQTYVLKVEEAFPDDLSKMPGEKQDPGTDIIANSLQESRFLYRALLEQVLEEEQDITRRQQEIKDLLLEIRKDIAEMKRRPGTKKN